MANPLGVSCALETSDGWLLLGRRNDSVAYYPNRIHPFAGSMDPRGNPSPNVFDEIARELREEIGLQLSDLAEMRCVALIEDTLLHHPELMFTVRTFRTRGEVEARLDVSEHEHVEAVRCQRESLEAILLNPTMTPVALASVALWGRGQFSGQLGQRWFEDVCR
jgi:8-oxo-dGTP pyrophosphatase MutT (NUDIX family)